MCRLVGASGGPCNEDDAWTVTFVLSNLVGMWLLDRHAQLPAEDVGVAMNVVEDRTLTRIRDGRWTVEIAARRPRERLELLVDDAGRSDDEHPADKRREPMTMLRQRTPARRTPEVDSMLSGRRAMRLQCEAIVSAHKPSDGLKRFARTLAHNVGVDRLRGARRWLSYAPLPELAAADMASEPDAWAELERAIAGLDEPRRSVASVRLELSRERWPAVVAELDRRGVRNATGAAFTEAAAKKLISRLAEAQPLFALLVNPYRSADARAQDESALSEEREQARERREARQRAGAAARRLLSDDPELYVLLWARMREGHGREGELQASAFLGRHVTRAELLARVNAFLATLDDLAARQLTLVDLARPRRSNA